MRLIKKGAEGDIFEVDGNILKRRVSKGYRIKELDEKIRSTRKKSEQSILIKAKKVGANVPVVKDSDSNFDFEMEKINGDLVKDILSEKNYSELAEKIADQLILLHENEIVHGDLTTSNMILDKNGILFLIDFGLAKHSNKAEDKAVDLHLIEETLESTHQQINKKMFDLIAKRYQKNYSKSKEVIQRLEKLRERGRYKKITG